MEIMAKTILNRHPKKRTLIEVKSYKNKHHGKPQQTELTSCPLHAAFERFTQSTLTLSSITNQMYDTRLKHKERANGIKYMR